MSMRRFLTCGLLGLTMVAAYAQHGEPLRIMSWNVENCFDLEHDEGFQDEEFLPTGSNFWTPRRYWQKLNDIMRVIAAVTDDGRIPDLIGLCEVENDSVLTALTKRTNLRYLGFQYLMSNSLDPRGIDVALLYLPEHFKPLEHQSIRIPSSEHGLSQTRDILYVKGLRYNGQRNDTLHVMVVHLPSRTTGFQGDKNRRLAAQTLWAVVDSIDARQQDIVVMGDFNATARDRIFKHQPLRLTDNPQYRGTYCYRGHWQWIDHILVSKNFNSDSLARTLQMPWLLEYDERYNIQKPRRTYYGPVYHGGISDHLPIVIDVR